MTNQMRHNWSRGYWPIMNSVRLEVIAPQRASPTAHVSAERTRVTTAVMARSVSRPLYHVLKKFCFSHGSGPIVLRGGGNAWTDAMLNAPPVGRAGCRY